MSAWAQNPIDAFILAKLEEKKLRPAPEADRRTLIRRLSFDLLGLPPDPDEVARFLEDRSPDAYERLVDRLLASPHLRRTLGAALDGPGAFRRDSRPRPGPDQAQRLAVPRLLDRLVQPRHAAMPRFVQEQVAADALFPDEPRLAVAQGMLAAGPWDESSLRDIRDDSIDRLIGHYIDRDDMVTTVMSTFASATVHCARCHDHKFDPISQEDYYSLQAVFAGVDKAERGYDSDPVLDRMRRQLKLEIKATEPRNPDLAAWLKVELAALPPQALVFAAASDFLPDNSHVPPGKPRPVHLLKRGDIHQPGKAAVPGTVSCVDGLPARFSIAPDDDESARRAALARWITDPENPLTWRSIVNRVWHWHFGRGLVSTPSDFGRMGSAPSHPELLDWLASRFLESGGSLKSLHRLIVTSAVYRQSVRHDASFAAIDGDNQWLWRQNRRRLDAESVHDAILAVSRPARPARWAARRSSSLRCGPACTSRRSSTTPSTTGTAPARAGGASIAFFSARSPTRFSTHSTRADASQLTAVRNESTTPLQALELLNSPFVLRQCEEFARRLEQSHGGRIDEQVAARHRARLRPPGGLG